MKLAPFVLFALLAGGCVTASTTPLTSSFRPPLDPSQVAIYLDPADIPGPYEKIGLIHAKGDSVFTNESMMMEKGRKEAARLGGNGLLLTDIHEASDGAKIAAEVFGTSTNRRGQMIAIYVHAPPAPGAARASGAPRARTPGQTQTFDEWLAEQDGQP